MHRANFQEEKLYPGLCYYVLGIMFMRHCIQGYIFHGKFLGALYPGAICSWIRRDMLCRVCRKRIGYNRNLCTRQSLMTITLCLKSSKRSRILSRRPETVSGKQGAEKERTEGEWKKVGFAGFRGKNTITHSRV